MFQHSKHRVLAILGAAAIAVVASACGGSTKIEQKWAAPPAVAQAAPLTKIVTLFVSNSESIKRSGEDRLARELTKSGVVATPAYAVVDTADRDALKDAVAHPDSPEVQAVSAKLRGMGYDGLVMMQIVDKEQDITLSPSYSAYDGYWGYGGWGWGYGGYYPGHTYVYDTYSTETSAVSLRTGKVVWSGRLKTEDPENAKDLLGGTSKVVTKELRKQREAG